MKYRMIDTPVGKLLLAGDDRGLSVLSFRDGTDPVGIDPGWTHDPDAL